MVKTFDFFVQLDSFISALENGKHLMKNGSRMRPGSIKNYKNLRRLLFNFSVVKNVQLEIVNLIKCTQKEYLIEKKKWKRIHKLLNQYLYKDCNHFDNYVGSVMKLLRSFFNYLKAEKGIDTREIPKIFYVIKEEIPIVVLSVEQLDFLISNLEFENSLSLSLQKTKDIFAFGCAVGLRISDLLSLTKSNLEKNYKDVFLMLTSKKTKTCTRIKLPAYAIKILEKYAGRYKTLLPKISIFNFNKNCRMLIEKAGWVHSMGKRRSKRGVTKNIRKSLSQNNYRFCDLISSHTMRRTAITMYLTLGMPEQLVRRISGHSPSSSEFFKYVKISEEILEKEISKVHSKLEKVQ